MKWSIIRIMILETYLIYPKWSS